MGDRDSSERGRADGSGRLDGAIAYLPYDPLTMCAMPE